MVGDTRSCRYSMADNYGLADEARHVAFAVQILQILYADMTGSELTKRRGFECTHQKTQSQLSMEHRQRRASYVSSSSPEKKTSQKS